MNAPAHDVKDLLVDASIGLTFATDLFCFTMPETPDACVCVRGGIGDDPDHTDLKYSRPGVQVIVRGTKGGDRDAWSTAEDIKDVLDGMSNETINSARYICIWMTGDVLEAGPDETGRPLLSLNFRVHRTPAS